MATRAERSKPVAERTHYTSQHVDVPSSFLTTPPEAPVTFRHISFADSPVPEYAGCFAVLLDNVLAPWECAKLLQLAEASVPGAEEGGASWRPALVNMGDGYEAAVTDYRNSDRIIWDSQTVVDRVWQRCLQARGGEGEEDMGEMLSKTPEGRKERKGKNKNWGGEWKFERLNERMRFLKYTKSQFFKRKSLIQGVIVDLAANQVWEKAHCDGTYHYAADGTTFETHYTVHLYLNDSAKTSADGSGCVGGATSFLSDDLKRRLDVDPKAGSVLIFQHERLLHSGDEVHSGTKYTMRTDILYRWVRE